LAREVTAAKPLSSAKLPFGKIFSLSGITLLGKDAVVGKTNLLVEVPLCSNIYFLGKIAVVGGLAFLGELTFPGEVVSSVRLPSLKCSPSLLKFLSWALS
jgi:hypothetical protein